MFFNYPNIKNKNKKNLTTFERKLFIDTLEPYYFSFIDNLEIINNIYGGIEKIKITNYFSDKTGVKIKSSKINSEIYLNQILDVDDKLIFEKVSDEIIPGKYILEYIPLTKISKIENNAYKTFYYGNAKESDFDEYESFSEIAFKLIYNIECYENCETCSKLVNESYHYCIKCPINFYKIKDGEKCLCDDYIFIKDEGQNSCLKRCNDDYYIYIKSKNDKYCLTSCNLYKKVLYKDEASKICCENCSENINENKYSFNKTCVKSCPDNYSPDEKGICYKNEYEYYLYFNETIGEYQYTDKDMCPQDYPYLKKEKKLCVKNCENDEINNNLCYYNFDSETNGIEKNLEELKNNFNKTKLDNNEDFMIKDEHIIYTLSSIKQQNTLKYSIIIF